LGSLPRRRNTGKASRPELASCTCQMQCRERGCERCACMLTLHNHTSPACVGRQPAPRGPRRCRPPRSSAGGMAGGHPAATPYHPTRRRSGAPAHQAHGQLRSREQVLQQPFPNPQHASNVGRTFLQVLTLREFSRYLARRLPPSAGSSCEAPGDAAGDPFGLAGPALLGS
jgi:hypothetical protein